MHDALSSNIKATESLGRTILTRLPKGNKRTLFVEVLGILGTIDQGRGGNPPPQVLRLDSLTEVVGSVQRIGEVYVIIECVQRFKVPLGAFTSNQIECLREGVEVGILFMEDGTTRIREVSSAPRDNPQ